MTYLGEEIFRARLLSGAQTSEAEGFGWFFHYMLLPLVAFPANCFLILLVLLSPFALLRSEPLPEHVRPLALGILIGAAIVIYAIQFWYVYILPRKDCFRLCERGLQIRIGLRRADILFDDLKMIFHGRTLSRTEQKLCTVNRIFNPGIHAITAKSVDQSLTFVYTNGETRVFKGLLARFEPEDMTTLSEELIARHPRFGETPTTTASDEP